MALETPEMGAPVGRPDLPPGLSLKPLELRFRWRFPRTFPLRQVSWLVVARCLKVKSFSKI